MSKEREKTSGTESFAASGALPTIAIVGRPNVGKSSLFNAILKRRHAIVHFESGVTRDRVAASGVFDGRRFNLVDTGGLGTYSGERRKVGFWDQAIALQVDAAIEDAAAILFVVDIQDGLNHLDSEVAARLRASGKRILLVANKADTGGHESAVSEFNKLGFDRVFPVSCLHRRGIDSLMEAALEDVAPSEAGSPAARPLRIAVLGRPNVGKSSLVNKILGEERVIVSEVPGTTRDSIDVEFTLKCNDELVPAVLIDTAGLRKKSKIDEAVERYSMMRAEAALKSCDIALFVIEAGKEGATSQDRSIARMMEESRKGCIIVANKWDSCSGLKQKDILKEIRHTLPKMQYAPVVFTCAVSGYNFSALFEALAEIRAQMSVKISTAMVNRVIGDAVERNSPPVLNNRPFKIYYGTMTGNPPPTFTLFVNDPKLCADNYEKYLENYFRKAFEFAGFPIRFFMKERRRTEKGQKGGGPKSKPGAPRVDDGEDFE